MNANLSLMNMRKYFRKCNTLTLIHVSFIGNGDIDVLRQTAGLVPFKSCKSFYRDSSTDK